ncbi:Zn-dependent hydrolase [Pseudoroseomonas deserti]|uniref:Zn-dependent hydrolase n=1 Tax=Teichococcus deserti TaxID=1817963 RepID=A0A1V2H1K9_9PROT|nr:Zn-dependent hydrolase [Pseudoroseomonas deserti]ONG51778.1 Zn-dependent hydrolase [Pseudoroseomonas deserti]
MTLPAIDAATLMARLQRLGEVGRGADGRLIRLAGSEADGAGRDLVAGWMRMAGMEVTVDAVGNLVGLWRGGAPAGAAPVMLGSHIDTVIDSGIYDGCYGVLAGLAVIEALQAAGTRLSRPVALAAFTNEEGVRFAPDMLGSLVYAGGMAAEAALAIHGTDGVTLREALTAIGYAGDATPGFLRPHAYLELHIEQGPVLEHEGIAIGAVDRLQGISWQSFVLTGEANHAGTTPMAMRRDAGLVAAQAIAFLRGRIAPRGGSTLATVGTLTLDPGAINVIPGMVRFTLDLRDPDEARLAEAERGFAAELQRLSEAEGVSVESTRLARFEPVIFDAGIVAQVEAAAARRSLSCRRITSGAGHDAQMMARICPAAMIFVPSRGGISHNPREFTEFRQLADGAAVLLDSAMALAR